MNAVWTTELLALLRLAGPVILSQFASNALALIATAVIGRLGAEGGMFTVTTLLMARFGPETLAAHNVTVQAITAMFMILLGLAAATSVRVGQNAGAQDHAGARRAGLIGLALSITVMLSFAALEFLAPRTIFSVFVNVQDPRNAALIATATGFLTIAALFQTVDGLQVTANGALRGLHDTRIPLIISLIAYWSWWTRQRW